jgi:putative ABC transport system permease protein
MLDDEKQRAGLAPEQARRAALLELGGLEQVKEQVREVRAGALVEQVRQDLGYGLRVLGKNPGFASVAVITLALGIGANSAVFTIVDTVVFRPPPYRDADRLLKICGSDARTHGCTDDFSLPELLAIRAQNHVFEQVAADDGETKTWTRPDGSQAGVGVGMVTANWLSTLGVRPLLGRDFEPEEERPGHDGVAVLTHEGWRRHFGSDTAALGKTLTLDGAPVTVIGVLPPNVLRSYADLLMPSVASRFPQQPEYRNLDVFARLRPHATAAQARAELDRIGRRLEEEYPAANRGRRLEAQPLGKYYAPMPARVGQGLLLMLGAVALVLLVACANVANLLLARSAVRRRECVVRAALGASRARLLRQLLVENLVLFLAGGALGVLLANASVDRLGALARGAGYLPDRLDVAVDARVLIASLFAAVGTGLFFGLIPALQASKVDLNEGLRDSAPAASGGPRRGRVRRLLVVSELALALVLLVGFGLLVRSFASLHAVAGGFDSRNLLETDSDGGHEYAPAIAFWRGALETARAVPGVALAAVTSRPPMHGARHQRFEIEGRSPASTEDRQEAGDVLVSAGYFETMGIPLLRGRVFDERDTASSPPVIVVSQMLARRYFGEQDPIGRHVRLGERLPMTCCAAPGPVEGVWRRVVGVVGDVRQANLDEQPAVTMYRPYLQIVEHDMVLMVRARSATELPGVARDLRARLLALDANKQWSEVRVMRDVIRESESIRLRRFVLILLGSFAAVALLLAAVGTYGVTACAVAERTRELGVRIALGATRPDVLGQVLRETLRLALAGVAIGSAAALALSRGLGAMLFGVSATDAATYVGVSLLLAAVVLLAAWLPALRATRVDPIAALRHD